MASDTQNVIDTLASQCGGPAFPFAFGDAALTGMSLRDWFAGQALAGFLAAIPATDGRPELMPRVAAAAFDIADAMLAERAKAGQP